MIFSRACRAWKSESRLRFLPRFQQRLVRPLWCEGGVRAVLVEELDGIEGSARCLANGAVNILHQAVAFLSWHGLKFSSMFYSGTEAGI